MHWKPEAGTLAEIAGRERGAPAPHRGARRYENTLPFAKINKSTKEKPIAICPTKCPYTLKPMTKAIPIPSAFQQLALLAVEY